jgi:hypothetical protein
MKQMHKDMLTSSAIAVIATRAVLMATTPAGVVLVVVSLVSVGWAFYQKERDKANGGEK